MHSGIDVWRRRSINLGMPGLVPGVSSWGHSRSIIRASTELPMTAMIFAAIPRQWKGLQFVLSSMKCRKTSCYRV